MESLHDENQPPPLHRHGHLPHLSIPHPDGFRYLWAVLKTLSIPACPGMRKIPSNIGKSSVHYSVALLACPSMCPAHALRPPPALPSFPSPFRIRSCTHASKEAATNTTRGEEDRVTAALPPSPPSIASRPARPTPCSPSEVQGGKGGREPPINSHVYLDLKVGVFRQTRPIGRPRC